MPVEKGERFAKQDIYIDYPFEDVMYRWDHQARQVFVRFYGKPEAATPVPSANRLFNDALLYGEEISAQQYHLGRARP